MSTPENSNVMRDNSAQPSLTNSLAFHCHPNGQCPGSIAKRMRRFEKQNDRNANAIWSEWVLPVVDNG